jgi:hypothetical protein
VGGEKTGDVRAYAQNYSAFLRAFTEPVIRMAIEEVPDLEFVIADLYSTVEVQLAGDLLGYACHDIQVAALPMKG